MTDHEQLRHGIHELRNAFTTIIGCMELLRPKLDPDLVRYIDRCMVGVERGTEATKALSDVINTIQAKASNPSSV